MEKGLIIFEECLIIFGQKLLIQVIVKLQQIFGILRIEEMKLESGKKGDGKTRNKDKIVVEYVFKHFAHCSSSSNSFLGQITQKPRKQKMWPLKIFWNKPPSNPVAFEQERP